MKFIIIKATSTKGKQVKYKERRVLRHYRRFNTVDNGIALPPPVLTGFVDELKV